MKYVHIARFLSEAALLWVIWLHTHWSVAVLLAILLLDHEMTAYVLRKIARVIRWPKVGERK